MAKKKSSKIKSKASEPKVIVPKKPEEPKLLVLDKLEINIQLVNQNKALRSVAAANGQAKPQSAEGVLAGKFKGEGLEGEKLVLAIYEGLKGLVNAKKAIKNRENEKKAQKEKRKKRRM